MYRSRSLGFGRSSRLRDSGRLLGRRRVAGRIAEEVHQNIRVDGEIAAADDDDQDQHQKQDPLFHARGRRAFFPGRAEDDSLVHLGLGRVACRCRFLGEEQVPVRQCIHRICRT
ncbi:MAG: hypothetical protein A3H49_07935 [Nitrospirae bacterium RIFCSPLOWO2_02_FULL_62_14]|nr:MAG: hypothetical protein A3H49_07935 [Nitrospirae bacterium RIFCSPLOWO2_02_FULL_62_14]